MNVFHGALSEGKTSYVLKHFGSTLLSSIHRLNSMFVYKNPMHFNGKEFIVCDYNGKATGTLSIEDVHDKFIAHIRNTQISKIDIDLSKSFRIVDCWGDDPIGSSGMDLFSESDLSKELLQDLKKIFYPFDGVIYPQDVSSKLSADQLKRIKKNVRESNFGSQQIKKRKFRAKEIGEDFNIAANYEHVWVYLTLQMRQWALKNDYDSFVYKNNGEGYGEDGYITLKSRYNIGMSSKYVFDEDLYRDRVSSVFRESIEQVFERSKREMSGENHTFKREVGENVFWAQQKPQNFWKNIPV